MFLFSFYPCICDAKEIVHSSFFSSVHQNLKQDSAPLFVIKVIFQLDVSISEMQFRIIFYARIFFLLEEKEFGSFCKC